MIEEGFPALVRSHDHGGTWIQTLLSLLSLQLGWGLWLLPAAFARLGWCALLVLLLLGVATCYSASLFARLYAAVPGTVLFADIGQAAAGSAGARAVGGVIYTLDATRCVILHLAATQSLAHTWPPGQAPPLWQCGLAVAAGMLVIAQARSMGEMAWVFALGTTSQLLALAVVVADLVSYPDPGGRTAWAEWGGGEGAVALLVAALNMVFAFGGQFAFVEIMGGMAQPRTFATAALACTALMGVLYAGLGSIGYACRGAAVSDVVVYALRPGPRARAAAVCILLQAIAQYLVNLHVWCHNCLTLAGRWGRGSTGTSTSTSTSNGASPHSATHSIQKLNPHHDSAHRGTVMGAASSTLSSEQQAAGGALPAGTQASEHAPHHWLAATATVIACSYCMAMALPFFSALVALVSGATYLVCAYTLPAWFALRLLDECGHDPVDSRHRHSAHSSPRQHFPPHSSHPVHSTHMEHARSWVPPAPAEGCCDSGVLQDVVVGMKTAAPKLWPGERQLLLVLVPVSLALSAAGLWASIAALAAGIGQSKGTLWTSQDSSHG